MIKPTLLLAGGTGFIGKVVQQKALDRGWNIRLLVRDQAEKGITAQVECLNWNPQQGYLPENALDQVDYIVNLAGSTIFQPWTARNKKNIRDSRLDATTLLFNATKTTENQVKAYVGASAVGLYANELDYIHTESHFKPNPYFLGEMVHLWEQAHKRFAQVNVPTAILRFGLVLGKESGFLAKQIEMAKPVGWPYFGSGKQWQSWIHVDDLAELICQALERQVDGAINAVAPEVVTQKQLMEVMAEAFPYKKRVFGIPSFALRIGFGARADLLLDSNHVVSEQLNAIGFTFRFPNLQTAAVDLAR